MKERVALRWTEQLLFGSAARKSTLPLRQPGAILRTFFTSPRHPGLSRVPKTSLQASALLSFRLRRSAFARRLRWLRSKSDKANSTHVNPTPHLGSPEPAPSLSQRLKQLSREYGWTALGVYLGLSVLDFPLCFLAVRFIGTDRIGHYEDVVKEAFWSVIRLAFPDAGKKTAQEVAAGEVAEAKAKASGADASIWTQLGLAYLVHKSLIFFRVPLTAAVLPKVVKTLRSWGYNVGKKKPKPA
ncbi:DUF1279 superfamily [Coniothyrium glycines]